MKRIMLLLAAVLALEATAFATVPDNPDPDHAGIFLPTQNMVGAMEVPAYGEVPQPNEVPRPVQAEYEPNVVATDLAEDPRTITPNCMDHLVCSNSGRDETLIEISPTHGEAQKIEIR